MKKLLFTLLLVSGISTAFAQSRLKVYLYDRSRITVEVDGKHFPNVGTSVTVGDLPGGRHTLRIYSVGKNMFGRPNGNLIYEGRVKTREGNITLFELDTETGGINVYDEDMETYTNNPTIQNEPAQNNDYKNSNVNNTQQRVDPAPPVKIVATGTLTEAKINALQAKVEEKKADIQKLGELKSGLQGEKVTTEQAGKIMDWLNFESAREEFLEAVYDKIVDKDNFGSLESKFTYKNYQDDFENFLKKHQ